MPGDPTATTPPPGYRSLGRLGRAFQLEGGVRLVVTDPRGSAALDRVERVFVPGFGSADLRRVRSHGSELVVYLEGVRDRDAATALTGRELFVPARPDDAEADATDVQALVGLPVAVAGTTVGHVREVRFAAVNPVLVVATARGEALVPLAAPYVRLAPERVELIDAPEGLLEPA